MYYCCHYEAIGHHFTILISRSSLSPIKYVWCPKRYVHYDTAPKKPTLKLYINRIYFIKHYLFTKQHRKSSAVLPFTTKIMQLEYVIRTKFIFQVFGIWNCTTVSTRIVLQIHLVHLLIRFRYTTVANLRNALNL